MTITSASTFIPFQPSLVRSLFLDFPNLTTWDKSYLTSLVPLSTSSPPKPTKTTPLIPHPMKTTGDGLIPGDRLHATFWGGEAVLKVLENSQDRLRLRGVWLGLVAIRTFEYTDAEEQGVKGTRFMQSEEAKGFMGGVLFVDAWMGGNLRMKFVKFNDDLKGECERRFRRNT